MLFLIEANVKIKVRGISGMFSETACYLVNADDAAGARVKFERKVNEVHANKMPERVDIEFTKIAPEI